MKQFVDFSQDGTLTFADPMKLTSPYTVQTRRSTAKSGIAIVRVQLKQVVALRKPAAPGCEDSCNTVPFNRSYELRMSTEAADTVDTLTAIRADIEQFLADLDVAIAAHVLAGAKPNLATTFPDVTLGE